VVGREYRASPRAEPEGTALDIKEGLERSLSKDIGRPPLGKSEGASMWPRERDARTPRKRDGGGLMKDSCRRGRRPAALRATCGNLRHERFHRRLGCPRYFYS